MCLKPTVIGLGLVVAMLAAGCGEEPGQASSSATTTTSGGAQSSLDSIAADGSEADVDGDSGGAGSDTTENTGPTANDDGGDGGEVSDVVLPGDYFDIGPQAGESMDVVSVRYDDVLNFRVWPDPLASIVNTAAPQSTSPLVISRGEGRLLERSAWWKVTIDGEEAWANFAFLGVLGRTEDVLAELEGGLASTEAVSVEVLVSAIANSRADGPVPTVTYVTEIETVFDGDMRVTIDVVGLGDDALKGERLTLTVESTGSGYRLKAAERTLICGRGVAEGGACV